MLRDARAGRRGSPGEKVFEHTGPAGTETVVVEVAPPERRPVDAPRWLVILGAVVAIAVGLAPAGLALVGVVRDVPELRTQVRDDHDSIVAMREDIRWIAHHLGKREDKP